LIKRLEKLVRTTLDETDKWGELVKALEKKAAADAELIAALRAELAARRNSDEVAA
jgi:hypothetical protein